MSRGSRTLSLACVICAVLARVAVAAPSVTAVLSNSDVVVGEMVQLEIRLSEAGSAVVPNDIRVDGLEIHQTGTSRQFEMRNFTTTSSITYTYTVLPLKSGTFKIPSQTVRVAGTSLQTPELTLRVSGAPQNQTNRNANAGTNPPNGDRLAFAELVVPKKTAFVGEMIPVIIRVCFATRAFQLEPIEITAPGFTMQKLQGTDTPSQETINGRNWDIFTFKTAIAPTRPGKFEIGPAKTNAVVAVPRRRGTSRSRSPFDPLDDPFLSDPFFRDPFGSLTQKEKISVPSEPVTLEVKPLPGGAPPTFSGAVGNFSMNTDAKPKSVQVGDPITVTTNIAGRGNFDRVNAPAAEDESGWHKYPPSSKFKQDDDVGISGQKTFETVLSPNEKKTTLPIFAFTYFDPGKEQYVTLRSDSLPIRVEGGAANTAAAATTSAAPAPGRAGTPTMASTPPPRDILYQLTERPAASQSFTPLYTRRAFWLAQLIPIAGLLMVWAWKFQKDRRDNREARRIAALQHEAADLTRKLRRSDTDPAEYYPDASRLVQVKTALARNLDPNVVDLDLAAKTFDLDEAERAQLQQIFNQSDELRYSGANGNGAMSDQQKRDILRFIESLRA